ncbi:MAG: EamA family transporter [Butyricicoccaceae bacterium]
MNLYWPILLVVASNTFYHICAKSMPEKLNPLASLVITYLISALVAVILYFVTNPGHSLVQEYQNVNWTSFLLGIAIVGLEFGNIYMYKIGWNINTGYLVQSILLAVTLLVVGLLLYHEAITWTKLLGILICMIGIYFLNQ